jgi:6-phosphogluconolactonase
MKLNTLINHSLLILMSLIAGSCKENKILFAGGFTEGNGKGLFLFDFSEGDGSLKLISENDAGPDPSFFCFSGDQKMIYAANEVMEFNGMSGGGVTALEYDPGNNSLRKKGEIVVPFGGPCFISLSPDGGFLLLANYSSSSVSVVKLDNKGLPMEVSDTILYAPEGQNVSHPHKILPDPSGKHIYVTDLGLDRIMIYDFDTISGKLIPFRTASVSLSKGSGPRHFVFNADGSLLYVINELGSTVMVFAVNENEGLKLVQALSTLEEGFTGKNYCAEILMGKNGDFIYGSNRGENSIVVFKIEESGTLSPAGHVSCGGDWPRNFVIDPSGKFLLAGNERSGNISTFRINAKTGIPDGPVNTVSIKAPACLKFWN